MEDIILAVIEIQQRYIALDSGQAISIKES